MPLLLLLLLLLLPAAGHLGAQALEATAKSAGVADAESEPSSAAVVAAVETPKDKRQVSSKETSLYPNHRSDAAAAVAEQADDPEDGQETIYGPKPNQFIIRPIAPHQHQQHESHQEPQLRNFAAATANARPHAAQLLEQSQEVSEGAGREGRGGCGIGYKVGGCISSRNFDSLRSQKRDHDYTILYTMQDVKRQQQQPKQQQQLRQQQLRQQQQLEWPLAAAPSCN